MGSLFVYKLQVLLCDMGIHRVIDIIENDRILSYAQITQKYSADIHFLEYYQICDAIPASCKFKLGLQTNLEIYENSSWNNQTSFLGMPNHTGNMGSNKDPVRKRLFQCNYI